MLATNYYPSFPSAKRKLASGHLFDGPVYRDVPDLNSLSSTQLTALLQQSWDDAEAGLEYPAVQVKQEFMSKYGT